MTQPYVGQIQAFGFNFAPRNWALCNGQTIAISQNQALFALLGTYYGGNGISTFQLPNLQSRVPMHQGTFNGNSYVIGEFAGEENVQLQVANLPAHTHLLSGTASDATASAIGANGPAFAAIVNQDSPPGSSYYAADTNPLQPLAPNQLGPIGGGQAHSNLQPYLTINFCIALFGIFPSRN